MGALLPSDPFNRLDYSQRNGVTNLDVTLDAIGNVTWKSDVGNFTYHATKRRAVVSAGSNTCDYDANGNMRTRNGSTISYASYNLPTSIASGANSSTLAYGAWRNTVKQVAVTSGTTETTIYVAGLLEKVTKGTTTEYRHRIEATPGTVAIYVRKSSGSNATYYLHRDHLGSPGMITNASGTSVVKLSFSAYGERRDVDWDGPITSSHLTSVANVTRHGYTDHLHLDSVKLVHMGGRVYDPVIGRFLSRDPYIDGVQSSQGANGYAYVWNNPLSRWDPTGYGGTHENFAVWANFGRGERRISNGLEEIIVTGRQSYWELTSSLIAHEFRLALIGSGPSGSGGDPGGGGSGSGGGGEPVGSKEKEPLGQQPCTLVLPSGQYATAQGVDARFNPETADMLSKALANLNQQGITPVITSGYRSPQAQSALRNSTSPTVITPARVSWHQVGAAVDFGPNSNVGDFDSIVTEMTEVGFVWGGNFRTPDRPHFQSQPAGTSPSASSVQSCAQVAGGG